MDKRLLISWVQSYEPLYNFNHPDYSDQPRRDSIWEEIGQIMKFPSKLCREQWRRIRENHRKALNLRTSKCGQAARKMKAPKYGKELQFLVPYLFDPESRLSITAAILNDRSETSIAVKEEDMIDESELSQIANIYNLPSIGPSSSPSPSLSNQSSIDSIIVPSKRRKSLETSTDASIEQQQQQHKKQSEECEFETSHDPLTSFFLNMAQTVKQFPLEDQITIKAKLFTVVNEVEMRLAKKS